jgi:drug/metabolite transporter (DMT)-like permease
MPTLAPAPPRAAARATLAGLAAIVLWAALALLTTIAGPIPPFQMVAMTFAVGAAVGVAAILVRGGAPLAALRQPPRVWALGVGGLFGYHALYFLALNRAPAAEANLVNYLWPLLIVLLSAPLAGERLRAHHLAGAALGLVAVAVLGFGRLGAGYEPGHLVGYAAALGCALVWSLYSVLSRRVGEAPTDAVAGFCAAAALLSLGCHLAFETTTWPASANAWAAVLALGVGPAGAAFYFWDHAVKRGDIRALGGLSYLAPVASTLLLALFGRAEATLALFAATALVTAGAVLAARDVWRRR